MSSRTRLLLGFSLALIIFLTILIYWPGVHGGFALDDYGNIVNNHTLQIHNLHLNTLLAAAFSSHSGPLDRPISMLSFALDEYFWGPAPYSMKATNIFIHALNGLLLFIVSSLILKIYRQRFRPELSPTLLYWTALAITSAWLLLPINLTAVLYTVQRMTSLSGSFVLMAIALYLWGRIRMLEGRTGFWLLLLSLFIFGPLAVLAKESGALLPVYTLALEWSLFGFYGPNGQRDRRLYLFYLVVLVLPGMLGLVWMAPSIIHGAGYKSRLFTMDERLLTEPRVIVLYIIWSLVPNLNSLTLYHDAFPFSTNLLSPPTTLLSIVTLAVILAFAIWQRRDRPLLGLGLLWFLGGQLLTGTFFPLELVFEQRNYLPDIGLLLALFSTTLFEVPTQRLALARHLLVMGFVILYAVITALRVHEWSNPVRFALISEAAHPASPRATYELGRTYAQLVRNAKSPMLPLANKALKHAASVPHANLLPDSALLIMNARFHHPLKTAWWDDTDKKLSSGPVTPQDINALTAMVNYAIKGNLPKNQMIRVFHTALKWHPNNPNVITLYSNYAINHLHNYPLALQLQHRAISLSPHVSQYRINLTRLEVFLGHYKEATAEIRYLQTHNRMNHLDDAIKSLKIRLANARKPRGHTDGMLLHKTTRAKKS